MPSGCQWLDTAAAAVVLDISPRRLRELRKKGLFKLGKHYRIRSAPGAGRPTYQWHVKNCEQVFNMPLEKRG